MRRGSGVHIPTECRLVLSVFSMPFFRVWIRHLRNQDIAPVGRLRWRELCFRLYRLNEGAVAGFWSLHTHTHTRRSVGDYARRPFTIECILWCTSTDLHQQQHPHPQIQSPMRSAITAFSLHRFQRLLTFPVISYLLPQNRVPGPGSKINYLVPNPDNEYPVFCVIV